MANAAKGFTEVEDGLPLRPSMAMDGTWERVHAHLVQWERVVQGHEPVPSAASLDSQSVKADLNPCCG